MSPRYVLIFLNGLMPFLTVSHQILARIWLTAKCLTNLLFHLKIWCMCPWIQISIVFPVVYQSGSSEMTTISQITYTFRIYNQEHNSTVQHWASHPECDVRGEWPLCEYGLLRVCLSTWDPHHISLNSLSHHAIRWFVRLSTIFYSPCFYGSAGNMNIIYEGLLIGDHKVIDLYCNTH